MLYNGNPNYGQFRQPPIYATFPKDEIDTIRSYPDFAMIKFFATKTESGHDSVLAVGCNMQGQPLNPTNNPKPIRFDNVPCPPECHIQNADNPSSSPNSWLSLNEAQQTQQLLPSENRLSASFQSGEIQGLWMMPELAKIRVYYGLYNETPTFLVIGADGNGNNLPGFFLLDPNPVVQSLA